MAWSLSTGMQLALLGSSVQTGAKNLGSTFTFTDTAITDSGSGFGSFAVDDWALVIGGINNNVVAKVLAADAGALTCAAGSFTPEAAGTDICITKVTSGSFKEMMQNGVLRIFTTAKPISADAAESGTLLAPITAGGGVFAAGASANGLNLGTFAGSTLKRGIDPATGATEIWSGDGVADGTAYWGRWYANDMVIGASTVAVRMDGLVTSTAGGDIVMTSGLAIAIGVPAVISDVNVTMAGV